MPTELDAYEARRLLEEEQRKAWVKEYERKLNDPLTRLQQGSPQVDQVNLSPEQIADYKSRLTTNLDKREELRDYLLGLLYQKQTTQDPTVDPATGDVSYTEGKRIKPISAQELANEAKQGDRRGKSGIGNFFRNIDYSLSEYKNRDMGIAANQQRQAMMMLDNLLKDQGSEIRSTFGEQNRVSGNNRKLDQTGAKAAADILFKQSGLDQKSLDSSFTNNLKGLQARDIVNMGPLKQELIKSQTEGNKSRTEGQDLRNKFFAPYMDKERQTAYQMVKLQNGGKEPSPDDIDAFVQKDRLSKATFGALGRPSGESSTTRPFHYVNADGSMGTSMETSSTRRGMAPILSTPQARKLMEQAQIAAQPGAKSSGIVKQALEKTQDQNERVQIAAAMLNPNTPKVEKELLAKGRKYVIEPTGEQKQFRAANDALAYTNRNVTSMEANSVASGLGSAYVKGIAGKVFGPINNQLSAARKYQSSFQFLENAPIIGRAFKGNEGPEDVSDSVRRMSSVMDDALRTNSTDNAETQAFKTWFLSTVNTLKFGIQKDATGLVALAREMDSIAQTVPQITDSASLAMTAMAALAIKMNTKAFLAKQGGRSPEDAGRLADTIGKATYRHIAKTMQDLDKARTRNLTQRMSEKEINQIVNESLFSPEEIIGRYVEETGQQIPGISIRKLTDSPQIPTQDQDFLNSLDSIRKLPSRKKK